MNFMFYISKFDCFNFYERWAICMMKNIQVTMTGENDIVCYSGITE